MDTVIRKTQRFHFKIGAHFHNLQMRNSISKLRRLTNCTEQKHVHCPLQPLPDLATLWADECGFELSLEHLHNHRLVTEQVLVPRLLCYLLQKHQDSN